MLKQLTSMIAYSPSLIDEVIEHEKTTKQRLKLNSVVLVLVIVAIATQGALFAVSVDNRNGTPNDIVYGGLTDQKTAHQHCLRNKDFQDVLAYQQISCEHLSRGETTTLRPDDYGGYLTSFGRSPRPEASSSNPSYSSKHQISDKTYHSYHLSDWYPNNQLIEVIKVQNRQGISHYISIESGSVISVADPTPQINVAFNSQGVLSQTTNQDNEEYLTKSVSVKNLNQDHPSTTNLKGVRPGDTLTITLQTLNSGAQEAIEYQPRIFVGDILEYATVIDYDGEQVSSDDYEIVWPKQSLKPQETNLHYFTIQVNSKLNNAPRSSRDPMSKDLTIQAEYGNSIRIEVISDSTLKNLEIVSSQSNFISTTQLSILWTAVFIGISLITLHNKTALAHLKTIKKRNF
jgi:hypothetical protein